ncbi:hypothetical protein NH340_JMT06761 [Sarcoptes scabiei]|nr:hypothetical protein NH340_JMT06761 [Sarcoptes scabiei]
MFPNQSFDNIDQITSNLQSNLMCKKINFETSSIRFFKLKDIWCKDFDEVSIDRISLTDSSHLLEQLIFIRIQRMNSVSDF